MVAKIWIGTSGYNYSHWGNGIFYPSGLARNKWLQHYLKYFSTTELNVTFYRLPSEKSFSSWYERTPNDFLFAIKGSRFITHVKRLKEPEDSLKLFFDRARLLRSKLGVILWQLPPRFRIDLERLEYFVRQLAAHPYRNAFEFREKSWFCKEVFTLLKRYNMALCQADYPGLEVRVPRTADFVYIRRHGSQRLYTSCYTEKELRRDRDRIRKVTRESRDIFVYFNNDAEGYAVQNASTLMRFLGVNDKKCVHVPCR